MKLAIAFLISWAVLTVSDVQKRQAFYWAPNHQPLGQYHYGSNPRIFRLSYIAGKSGEFVVPNDESSIRTNAFPYTKSDEEASPRVFGNTPGYIQTSNGLVVPAGGSVYYMNRLIRPVYVTSTVVVSNAIVSTCIPRNNFVSSSENNICSGFRRRREIVELLDQLDDGLDVAPSEVQQVEITRPPKMIDFGSHATSGPKFSEQLKSSQSEELQPEREKRFLNFMAPTVTVTAYSITNTTFTKTLQLLASTVSNQLACRPSSIVVC